MANPAVTYTFANSTTADATQVNQNFTDIINALTDGTKSLTIDALTAAGTVTLNGAVTLGNGTPDDISVLGSLASSVPLKTTNSYDIGSATIGLAGLYLGSSGGAFTTRVKGAAVSSSWTMTLPTGAGTSGYVLQTDGAGVTSWVSKRNPTDISNYSISTSVSSSALTIALKDAAGSDPSSTSPVEIAFRSSTASSSTVNIRQVTAATSMTVLSGATLGHSDGTTGYIWVYAIDNAGTVELAVSSIPFTDELSLASTTGISTSSDFKTELYSTTTRSNVPIRLLARLKSSQTTAGTWASSISEISLMHRKDRAEISQVEVTSGNGHGSTNTHIRRFSTTLTNLGSAITYADSAANGGSFTINEDGVYSIHYNDTRGSGTCNIGISRNSTQLTTVIQSITNATRLQMSTVVSANVGLASWTGRLNIGDVIRAHTDTAPDGSGDDARTKFTITKVGV